MPTKLTCDPSEFEMGALEVLPLSIDLSAWLLTDTISVAPDAISVALIDMGTGAPAPPGCLNGAPVRTSDTVVTQSIKSLTLNHRYSLQVTVVTTAGNAWTAQLTIRCVL